MARIKRPNTAHRWQQALTRAIADGCQLCQIAGTGEAIVTSGSRTGLAYRTDGVTCDCEAARLGGDPVCRHRALYRHHHGALTPAPTGHGTNLSDADRIALQADAMRQFALHGAPLIDPATGAILADAA